MVTSVTYLFFCLGLCVWGVRLTRTVLYFIEILTYHSPQSPLHFIILVDLRGYWVLLELNRIQRCQEGAQVFITLRIIYQNAPPPNFYQNAPHHESRVILKKKKVGNDVDMTVVRFFFFILPCSHGHFL